MSEQLSKEQKVLLALFRLWSEGHKKVRYEDIVVRAFKDYPGDFHLKGYPEFPDTGDAVHKPLYDYRKKGMVAASNKMFSLTTYGVAEAEKLRALEKGRPSPVEAKHRIERAAQIEIERIKQLEGFKLFLAEKYNDIIDSDLFEYLGVSVRSTKNDFIGRLEAIRSAMAAVTDSGHKDPILMASLKFHDFLLSRFAETIASKTSKSGPEAKAENGA